MPAAVRRSPTIKHREQFADMLNDLGLTGHAVEVGVHLGEFAASFLSRWRGSAMTLIDPWENLPGYVDRIAGRDRQADYEECKKRIRGCHENGRRRNASRDVAKCSRAVP